MGIKKINFTFYMAMASIGIFLTAFQRVATEINVDFTGGISFVATVTALLYAGIFLSSIIMGELSMRIGKKRVTIAGVISMISGQLVLFASASVLSAAAGSMLIGLGYGVCESQFSSLLVDTNPGRATRVVNFSQAILVAGAIVSPIVVNAYLAGGGGWRFVFLCLGGVFLILLLCLAPQKYGEKPIPAPERKAIFVFKLFREKLFTLLIVCMALYVSVEACAGFFMIDFFKSYGLSEDQGSLALSLFWLFMIPGRLAAGLLKNAERFILAVSIAVSGIAMVGVLVVPAGWMKVACFSLLGLGAGPTWPAIASLIGKFYPRYTGAAFGIIMASCAVGGIVSPLVVGFVADAAGISLGYILLAGIIAVMLLLQPLLAGMIRQNEASAGL